MSQVKRWAVALLVAASWAGLPRESDAGGLVGWKCPGGEEPAYYSPCRYWASGIMRTKDFCYGPWINLYPPNRHPEVPPTYYAPSYPSVKALPVTTIVPIPMPPATSPAR